MVPQEQSGRRIEKLDYEGSSDDEKERLTDDNVQELADALCVNDTF